MSKGCDAGLAKGVSLKLKGWVSIPDIGVQVSTKWILRAGGIQAVTSPVLGVCP